MSTVLKESHLFSKPIMLGIFGALGCSGCTKGIVFPSKTNDPKHLKQRLPKRKSHRPKRVFPLPGNEETYPTKREVKGTSTTQKCWLKTGWGYVLVSSQFGYSFHDFSFFFVMVGNLAVWGLVLRVVKRLMVCQAILVLAQLVCGCTS